MTLPVLAVVTIPAVGGALRSGDWTAVAWLALVYVVVLLATYYGWREGGYKRNRFEHRYGPLRD